MPQYARVYSQLRGGIWWFVVAGLGLTAYNPHQSIVEYTQLKCSQLPKCIFLSSSPVRHISWSLSWCKTRRRRPCISAVLRVEQDLLSVSWIYDLPPGNNWCTQCCGQWMALWGEGSKKGGRKGERKEKERERKGGTEKGREGRRKGVSNETRATIKRNHTFLLMSLVHPLTIIYLAIRQGTCCRGNGIYLFLNH